MVKVVQLVSELVWDVRLVRIVRLEVIATVKALRRCPPGRHFIALKVIIILVVVVVVLGCHSNFLSVASLHCVAFRGRL